MLFVWGDWISLLFCDYVNISFIRRTEYTKSNKYCWIQLYHEIKSIEFRRLLKFENTKFNIILGWIAVERREK